MTGENRRQVACRDKAVRLLMHAFAEQPNALPDAWVSEAREVLNALKAMDDAGVNQYWNDLAVRGGACDGV